ncbi:MAG: ABC transporter ATP-binding protein [Dethiobacteria bacterium]
MIIEIKKLSFVYAGGPTIFNDISFSVSRGQIICIIGPNGVGKTTLLNCMANLLTPKSGEILLDGKSLIQMKAKEIANKIAYVPQFIVPSFAYEVLSYVVTGCAPRLGTFEKPKREHYKLAERALEQMGISHLAHKYYTQISGGERQQVSIARALVQKPRVILMDEPTAHLDYGNQIKVLKIIKKLAAEGYAAVITTHNPDHALLLGGEVAAINSNGQFIFGSSNTLINEHFLSSLYGVDLRLHHIPDIGRNVCVAASL